MMNLCPYLIVKDLAKSMAFYTTFLQTQPISYSPGRFIQYNFDNSRLALYNPDYDRRLIAEFTDITRHFNLPYLESMKTPTRYGNNVVLNFSVEDLKNEYERIKLLAIGEQSDYIYINVAAPYWCFWLRDPDGNCIEVTGNYSPD
ncbi:MAG: VOC family protein [Oscillospiraceae bacterium]|nr:VOC family protein [Oscillospiraceae bacterium]